MKIANLGRMLTEDSIVFFPNEIPLRIFIGDLKEFTDTSITFSGKFRVESEILPFRQIMNIYDASRNIIKSSLILINTKKILDDTSNTYFDEEIGYHICLSPSDLIHLTYTTTHIFKSDNSDIEYWNSVYEELVNEGKSLFDKNSEYAIARERREMSMN